MPTNNRIFWAVSSLHIAECGTSSFTVVHGAQSVGITTRFNLEQVYELGQLELYEQFEATPDVEVTMEKSLDGYPLIYHLMTKGALSATIAGRSNKRGTVGLAIFSDSQDSASGTPVARTVLSGMYVSQVSYTLPTQGSCTESITAVGNNKIWSQSFSFTSMNNDDVPYAIAGSGGVQQREDVIFGACDTSVSQPSACVLPVTDIPGLTSSGTNELQSNGAYGAHIQSIRVSANLGRDQLFELGKRGPYYRYVNYPVQVTCDIETTSVAGDNITADENSTTNTSDRRIWLRLREGTKIDLGSRNKLNSVTYGGANAGQQGSSATATYSYQNFNSMTITHPQDPSGL